MVAKTRGKALSRDFDLLRALRRKALERLPRALCGLDVALEREAGVESRVSIQTIARRVPLGILTPS